MMKTLTFWLCTVHLLALQGGGVAMSRPAGISSDTELKKMVTDFGHGRIGEGVIRKADLSEVLPKLARIQAETPKTSELYLYIAFTLAYFGRDYQQNVRSLIYPVELWRKQDSEYVNYSAAGQEPPHFYVPNLLKRLYLKHCDPSLLRTLFSWQLDGGPAEALTHIKLHLLKKDPRAVLTVIQNSPSLASNAEEAIAFETYASDSDYKRVATAVKQLSRQWDLNLRRFARQFLGRVAARRKQLQDLYR